MDLNEIVVFSWVVQSGSFSGAARELGLPKSTVSRKIAALEERLGARLLQRTTRKLSLTDVGRAFFDHARRVVEEAEQAEQAVSRLQEAPRGLLRVTTPINFGQLGPMAASFLARYPEVELEIVCTDRVVDLVQDSFDLAIRAGQLADSTLVARSLGVLRSYAVASPAFLERRGRPAEPSELTRYPCCVFGANPTPNTWRLHSGSKTVAIEVRPRLTVNDFDFLHDAALAGLGIALLPEFRCFDDLRAKRLERVLHDWCSPDVPVHAVYPTRRHLSPKVKALLDHLAEHLNPPPWERRARR
jgi:DNA-binding transcriptional LysR family regulator